MSLIELEGKIKVCMVALQLLFVNQCTLFVKLQTCKVGMLTARVIADGCISRENNNLHSCELFA